jgi:hypothetical protein
MLIKVLSAVLALMLMLLLWIGVQSLARRSATRHPECGPFREAGGGCGGCGTATACAQARQDP